MTTPLTQRRSGWPREALVALALVIALGALLRLVGLDIQPLAHDEMSSVVRSAYDGLRSVIDEGVRPDVHPPGFQVVLYFVERWWGDAAAQVRLPSALAGVAAIPALAWVGSILVGWRLGLGAAALLSVSWTGVYYSQEARAYSLLMMGVIVATGCWLQLQRSVPGRRAWMWCGLYALAATFCAYVHYFGLLMVALLSGWLLLRAAVRRGPVAPMVVASVLLLVAYAPWLPVFLEQLRSRSSFWIDRPDGVATTLLELLLFSFAESFVLVSVVLGLVLTAAGSAAWRRLRSTGRTAKHEGTGVGAHAVLLIVAWIFVPFTVVYVRSVTATPMLTMRNVIVLVPAVYLLVACLLLWFLGRGRAYDLVIGVLAVVLVLHVVVTKDYYGRITKLQAREAVAAVVAHEDPGNVSVLSVGISPAYVRYQFRQQDERFGVDVGDRKATAAEIPGLLQRLVQEKTERAWVLSLQRPPQPLLVAGVYAALDVEHVEGLYFAAAWGGAVNAARLQAWLAGDLSDYRKIRALLPADDAKPVDPLRVPSFLPGNPGPLPVYLARRDHGGATARLAVTRYRPEMCSRAVFYALCLADRDTELQIRVGASDRAVGARRLPAGSWRWVFVVFNREDLLREGPTQIQLTAPSARRLYYRLPYLVPVL